MDLETTGISITKDRIIEIGIVKISPENEFTYHEWRIQTNVPIKKEAHEKHGISEGDLKDCPFFKDVAREILSTIHGCDLAGFNINRFDLPMLAEEMIRNGFQINPQDYLVVDCMVIYHHFFRRNLESAYKFYTGKTIDNAHTASADTKATFEILNIQMNNHPSIGSSIEDLAAFTWNDKFLDFEGKVVVNDLGLPALSFGKHKGKAIMDLQVSDPGYLDWFLKTDSSSYTKEVIQKARAKKNELDPKGHDDLPF